MNFKEALIAHLQGERVEFRTEQSHVWMDFGFGVSHVTVREIDEFSQATFEYRLVPHTILVNGVEVSAPITRVPKYGETYFVAAPHDLELTCSSWSWCGSSRDKYWLESGLIYSDIEDALARAKAMLIYKEV